jgi:hypothetical protein
LFDRFRLRDDRSRLRLDPFPLPLQERTALAAEVVAVGVVHPALLANDHAGMILSRSTAAVVFIPFCPQILR